VTTGHEPWATGHEVILYAKAGCHLCEDARAEIEALQSERNFNLIEIDIATDPLLHREYGERIPVIAVNGEEAFELGVDRLALARLLDTVAS
jgi:glutaredoxin